jgi:alpha-tubulin suppressor-like RCC1 family protein
VNDLGELGDGTNSKRLLPVAVAGGRRFRSVDIDFEHTCAVGYPDNRAYCWGSNRRGELGIGNKTGPEIGYYGAQSTKPIAVLGGLLFRQVATGNSHSCGLTTDDRVFCWGFNRYGQVGDNSTAWLRLKPFQVAGNRRYRSVDASREQTCAISTNHRAFCWGFVDDLANLEVNHIRTPLAVGGGVSFDRVTVGEFHACGETTANEAYCWGFGGNGNLGDGTRDNHIAPVAVVGGLHFSQLSAGGFHSCGRTADAVAWCWGRGFVGQLGNGADTTSLVPVAVAGAP